MELGKLQDQIDLEIKSRSLGIDRAKSRNQKMSDAGHSSMTTPGKALVNGLVDKVSEEIRDRVFNADLGHSGRASTASVWLKDIEPDVCAALTIKTLINNLSSPKGYAQMIVRLGAHIEDEIRLRSFEEDEPKLYGKVHADLEQRSSGYKYRRKKLVESAKRAGVIWEPWPRSAKAHVGGLLIDAVVTCTDLIVVSTRRTGKRQVREVSLSESTVAWISKREFFQGVNQPEFLPMLCTPRPWHGVRPKPPKSGEKGAGGYITLHAPQIDLVKTHNKAYLEELENHDMSEVYSAVNSLQSTMWKVDDFIYATATELWDSGSVLGSLPSQSAIDIPPKPHDIDTNEVARKEWRGIAAKAHTESNRLRSQRFLTAKTFQMAHQFKDADPMHFVYQLDFRSRAYPVSSYLQPQGNDLARSLLRYSDHHAKPMDDTAARHLAIYGAGLFGHDKVTLDDRVEWVEEHTNQIVASAENPFDNRFWCDADGGSKAFLFLAFCKEWEGWKNHGEKFYSTLPIMRDGTCNALQHWGAILKDDTIAGLVNLKEQELPGDAYTLSLEILIDRIKRHAERGNVSAQGWLNYRLDRSLTKKPTMTLTYGATKYATTEWLRTWIVENKEKHGLDEPFGGEWFEHGIWLTNEIWDAIRHTVGPVIEGMSFMQGCAKLAVDAGLPITWITPSNFYVRQAYSNVTKRRIKTRLMGNVIRSNFNDYKLDDYSRHQMINGIAANFIHSLDATAMFKTVNSAADRGVSAFSMIHDSYGTVAADTEVLNAATREAFVSIYKDADVLAEFRDQLKTILPADLAEQLPELPTTGDFDVSEVLRSQHFFS